VTEPKSLNQSLQRNNDLPAWDRNCCWT